MSNQLIKETALGIEKVFPKNYILNLVDKDSGKTLQLILNSFNMLFLSYVGNKADTRKQVPMSLRKLGLWITYVIDKTTVTEWYNSNAIDDTTWGLSTYWRLGSNMLVGDIAISANGTWVVNGEDTGISPKGDKGDSPVIRVYNNKLQVSYDNGNTYTDLNNTPVFTLFRFNSSTNTHLVSYDLGLTWQDVLPDKVYYKFKYNESTNTYQVSTDFGTTWSNVSAEKVYYKFRYNSSTNTHLVSTDLGSNWVDISTEKVFYKFRTNKNKLQVSTDLGTSWQDCSEPIAAWFRWAKEDTVDSVGKIQISRDELKTWTDLSPNITNNLRIKGYVATVGELPTSTAALGDIYMVGPTYDESDTTHDYPHYRMWVKQSSGWVDNGEYQSNVQIALTTGLETGITMSLKAITQEIISANINAGEYKSQPSDFGSGVLIMLSDGTESPYPDGRLTTDFIPVLEGNIVSWSGLQYSTTYCSLALYDGNKNFVADGCSGEASGKYIVASGVGFVRFCGFKHLGVGAFTIHRYNAEDLLKGNFGSAFTCHTAGNVAAKAIANADFRAGQPTRMLVKFLNVNSADSVTFMANNVIAPLYYNGVVASSTNSWKANEILDITYRDGAFYATQFYAPMLDNNLGQSEEKGMTQRGITDNFKIEDSKIEFLNVCNELKSSPVFLFSPFGVGGYANGVWSDNSDIRITDFIPVKKFGRYMAIGSKGSNAWTMICGFDKDKTFIANAFGVDEISAIHNEKAFDFVVPNNIAYVRVSWHKDYCDDKCGLYEYPNSVRNELMEKVLSSSGKYEIKRDSFILNHIIGGDGAPIDNPIRVTTDYIPIKENDVVDFVNLQYNATYYAAAIYDSDKNLLVGHHGVTGALVAPANSAYVRLSGFNNMDDGVHATIYRLNQFNSGKWENKYPHIFDGLSIKEKLSERNDDITIMVIGDSLSAFFNQWPLPNQKHLPCQQTCKNWFGNMARYVNDVPIEADRFDSTNHPFTETGIFSNDSSIFTSLPYWTADAMKNRNEDENGSITRYSDTENASIEFDWDLDSHEKMHFIHRLDYRAADSVTIAITEGNGKALVYDETTTSWVEANGYQFTQKIAQSTEGSGYAQTLANWRLQFKKAVGATGTITLKFTASGSGYFFYWGVEKWNGNRIIFVDSSRGGREVVYFQDVVKNDIVGRKPDLIIMQLMLINEYGNEAFVSHQTSKVVEHLQDFIFGDREGNLNANSLKKLSNDWEDFQVVCVCPHVRYEYFADEHTFKKDNLGESSMYMDEIAPVAWNKVKNMISSRDVNIIDVGSVFKQQSASRQWTYRHTFDSAGIYSTNGFTQDTVHQNVLGSLIWAEEIAPIFDI